MGEEKAKENDGLKVRGRQKLDERRGSSIYHWFHARVRSLMERCR